MSDTSKALDRMYALHKHQTATLERIATALEVIAYSDLRGEGFDDRGHLTKAAVAHFKEARDA